MNANPRNGATLKSMMILWRELANELASWCHTSATDDYKKLVSRVEAEGFSFLTISLPSFAKDFERGLEVGSIDDSMFLGFKKRGGLPLFLGGFLRQIFDISSGCLLDEPCCDSIYAVRQLTRLFAKIELPCSDSRTARAFQDYIECEKDLLDWESEHTFDAEAFSRVSRLLFTDVLGEMDRLVYHNELIPRHGPGATADRYSGNRKYDLLHWSSRLEALFPFGEFGVPSWRYSNRYDLVQILEPGKETPVKVVSVPKTLRAPRIIAEEPASVQYMQQAISKPLVELLECEVVAANNRDNLVKGFLGFKSQIPNRDMARRGSAQGDLATLDLSEASDRVHILHVGALCHGFPSFYEGLLATRSTKAEIRPLKVSLWNLRKYASMGSALTFPIEAMVFLTTIFLGLERQLGRPLKRKDVLSFRGKVRVYGDDIVVPVDSVPFVLDAFALHGFKVNVNKSFWNGKFRESCGGDYYDGVDVTPVRLKHTIPTTVRENAAACESIVAFRNHLYLRGLWRTTSWLDETIIGPLFKNRFPIVEPTSQALGRQSFLSWMAEAVDIDTQAPMVKAWASKPRIPANQASDVGSLLKCILPGRENPFEDPEHLLRSGRPSAIDIKLRWMSPF